MLRRAPPPTINGRPVAMIAHMGDTEVAVPAEVTTQQGGLDLKGRLGRLFKKR